MAQDEFVLRPAQLDVHYLALLPQPRGRVLLTHLVLKLVEALPQKCTLGCTSRQLDDHHYAFAVQCLLKLGGFSAAAPAAAGAGEAATEVPQAASQAASHPAIGQRPAAAFLKGLGIAQADQAVGVSDVDEIELGSWLVKGLEGDNVPVVEIGTAEIIAEGNISHTIIA